MPLCFQFIRMEDGVCGLLGPLVQQHVVKARLPESATATHQCPSWGGRTVKELAERHNIVIPSPALVSVSIHISYVSNDLALNTP